MFKYVGLLLAFRNVKKVYKEEQGQEKPLYLSKRFIGIVITFAALVATKLYGVDFSPDALSKLTEDITKLMEMIPVLYGIVLTLKGFFDYAKDKYKEGVSDEKKNDSIDTNDYVP